jgi:PEGA domain
MSLESFHRRVVVFLVGAIVFASTLITCVPIVAPAQAATNSTAHQSVSATPQCMRQVSVASRPCGATIYIDGIEVGRTPMSFPMPLGRYTLVLLAPGHQPYGRRFLVQDAPLAIDANLVPLP